MKISRTTEELASLGPSCLTIGNFDGVHMGHQFLIRQAMNLAFANDLEFVLVTFQPHPSLVLAPGKPHLAITSRDEKLRLLSSLGVENILEIPFTPAFASLDGEEFVARWLLPLKMRKLVVGHDFVFGKDGSGTFDLLQNLGQKAGFAVSRADALEIKDRPVSSTRLRACLKDGNVAEAATLLGRRHAISGVVGHGFGRGKGLGFPTANLEAERLLLPHDGVYATFIDCGGKKFQAVTNIGHNPTFNGEKRTIESFLLDASADLYDKPLRIEFVERLRDERKFSSPDALAAQIDADVAQARAILDNAK